MPTATGHRLPLADHLFDYQAWIVRKAMEARRYAVWADCGLGKTPMQLVWAENVARHSGHFAVAMSADSGRFSARWHDGQRTVGIPAIQGRTVRVGTEGMWCL